MTISFKFPTCLQRFEFPLNEQILNATGIIGDMDLLVYATAASMKRLHEIREFIDAQDDITKIKTHVVMSEWIDNQG
ncbi:Lrp/AsnC ligand binding domain-containing protein [Shewanella gelidimarina]|uniref:Lrp/AsnC ligand binding domain-containing protein n=1 Tax=Shewanella gelidimarina TaxID=56813 RepID=UPI003D161467